MNKLLWEIEKGDKIAHKVVVGIFKKVNICVNEK